MRPSRFKTVKKAPLGAFFIAWLFWVPAWALCPLDPAAKVEAVQIASVYDGDTVRLEDGRKVRLVGINTPEVAGRGKLAEPLAEAAKSQLEALLANRPIYLQIGKDREDHYGRVLGHLYDRSGNNLIAALLAQGAGFQVAILPNLQHVDCYAQAQANARQAGLGVWGHEYYVPTPSQGGDLRPGYAQIVGRIESVELTKKAIFVELEGQVSLKIEKKVAPHIDAALMDQLVAFSQVPRVTDGPMVEARGWLSDRLTWNGSMPELVRKGVRKRYQMKITHQVSWSFGSTEPTH